MKKIFVFFSVTALLVLFLTGCSERYWENQRIWRKADKVAEKRAVEYIQEKYDIEATPLGHITQGGQGGLVWYADTNVLVPMFYGNEIFCVGVDVDDKTILSDNHQSAEICAVLMQYFIELYDLPKPKHFEIQFHIKDVPYFDSQDYDTSNMVNFSLENQSAEELLERIENIKYMCQYTALPHSLDAIVLDPGDWPKQEDFGIELRMCLSQDRDTKLYFDGETFPDPWYWKYFREWLYTNIRNKNYDHPGEPVINRKFYSFRSSVLDGFTFITRLPYEPEDIIQISDEKLTWQKEHKMADGTVSILEYEQLSSLFEVTQNDPSTNLVATEIIVPDELVEETESDLYLGSLDKETGDFSVERIFRNGELEGSREYKYQTSKIRGIAPGYQYAILRKTAEKLSQAD